jgi:hypothetical protein
MIWSIPGTGFSGAIHLIAKRPYLLGIGIVLCAGLMVPTVAPLLSTETLPPLVFRHPPPPVFVAEKTVKRKVHHSASNLVNTQLHSN